MSRMIPGLNNLTNTVLCLLAFLFALTPVHSDGQNLSFLSDSTHYQWPTEASRYISSTFGETRSSHFHAGLDIRTRGREGYEVFATRDGIVSRISISPTGYGKVIFLKHDDESLSIYAHLNRFEESLMTFADSVRLANYSFLLNRNIEEHQIRVEQGDLIGYTGSSGSGPPHLHFELRTPNNEPFNPLLTNLSIDDEIPPVFSGFAVEHLNPGTLHVTEMETKRPVRNGTSYDFGTISASGPVGLSVNVHDRANRTPNVYAVYSLALVQEQDTLFHSGVDAFGYQDASQMFIDRVYPLLKEKRQGFQRLYVINGNVLPFYKTGETRGVVDLPAGTHKLSIIAKDYYGNMSAGTLTMKIDNRVSQPLASHPNIPAYPRNEPPEGNPLLHNSTLFSVDIEPSLLTRQKTRGPNPEPESAVLSTVYSNKNNVQVTRKKLVPGKRQLLHLPDQTIWVEFPADALFDTLQVEMTVKKEGDFPVISFTPDHIPLKNRAYINIILNKSDESQPVGLYSYNSRRNSHRIIGSGTTGSMIRSDIHELSDLYILQDITSPYVGSPSLQKSLAGFYVVNIPVADTFSGIDYLRSRITVNGEEGITEFDPDKKHLKFYKPDFEPLPQNEIEVLVYDRMGNVTHRTFERAHQ